MDSHWGVAFFLLGKNVTPGESRGNRTVVSYVRDAYESYNPVLRNLSSCHTNTKPRLSTSSLILLLHSPLRCESTSVTWGLLGGYGRVMGECEDQG